jgi:hypothetical protein
LTALCYNDGKRRRHQDGDEKIQGHQGSVSFLPLPDPDLPFLILTCLAAAAGCGGNGGGLDADGEVIADPSEDTGAEAETQGDPIHDPLPDETPDGEQDPAADPHPEAEDAKDADDEADELDAADAQDADDAPDAVTTCSTDEGCAFGSGWCVGGFCVPCDNSGLACDLACLHGWTFYNRNGCTPCDCAPPSACTADSDCISSGSDPMKCYAGARCWDWCPAGDPSCCLGNLCSAAGCVEPPLVGCFVRGCPEGETCTESGCASTSCICGGMMWPIWGCTYDCGGGTCVGPD